MIDDGYDSSGGVVYYKEFPIVFFTYAMLTQIIPLVLFFLIFGKSQPYVTLVFSLLVTLNSLRTAWIRGMNSASLLWKASLLFMLGGHLSLVILGVALRHDWI